MLGNELIIKGMKKDENVILSCHQGSIILATRVNTEIITTWKKGQEFSIINVILPKETLINMTTDRSERNWET